MEQIIWDLVYFKGLDINQVQLLLKRIILKKGKQNNWDKKVRAIHVVISEDKKVQARKSLKAIYPSIIRQYYLEGTQWISIKNIVDRDFTVIKQSAIVTERVKFNKIFFSNTCVR